MEIEEYSYPSREENAYLDGFDMDYFRLQATFSFLVTYFKNGKRHSKKHFIGPLPMYYLIPGLMSIFTMAFSYNAKKAEIIFLSPNDQDTNCTTSPLYNKINNQGFLHPPANEASQTT